MNDLNQSDIELICNQLFDECQGILSWKWDDWIGTFLAEFSADKEKKIRAILEKHLPITWDRSTINKAPPVVQELDEQLGGLKPTQFLFSSDPSDKVFVFCAWWPWGNGSTISIRIAPFDRNLSKQEVGKLKERLMALAGIIM